MWFDDSRVVAFQSISVNLLSVYGAVSGLCEKLAQKISDHSSSSTGDLMRDAWRIGVSNLTQYCVNLNECTFDQCSSTGRLVAASKQKEIRVIKPVKMLRFVRKIFCGQELMTVHDIDLIGFGYAGSCREHTSLPSDERSTPMSWIRGNTETGRVLEVKVTTIYINVELKSELNPWRMMDLNPRLSSAGVWTNTSTSFFKRMVKSIHYEDVALGARRPASTEQKEPSNPPLLSCVDNVGWRSLSFIVSKTMTRILLHRGLHRK